MTQVERLLSILSDGLEHSQLELYSAEHRLGPVHSVVARARRQGHDIRCRHEQRDGTRAYLYRLVTPPPPPVCPRCDERLCPVTGLCANRCDLLAEPRFGPDDLYDDEAAAQLALEVPL